jgi:cholesterol oxidase
MFGRRVVVAAGTLGSVELLLRCRDVARTLPQIGPALGQGFSGNGDMLFAGATRTRDAVEPGFGPSITARADCSTAEHLITVEDLGLPDPFFWFLEGALPPRRARLMGTLRLLRSYLAASLGFGTRYSPVSAELDGLLSDGHTARVMPFLGMGTDAADGTLSLRDGTIDVAWSHRKSRAMFKQMERAMAQISRAAGGKYARSVLWRWPFRKLLTAHPLGGCAPGDDRAQSVVNHHGEVWGYPGLYVVDGSIVPSALAVNPSLTIAALAERAAFWMLHGREMSAGGPS